MADTRKSLTRSTAPHAVAAVPTPIASAIAHCDRSAHITRWGIAHQLRVRLIGGAAGGTSQWAKGAMLCDDRHSVHARSAEVMPVPRIESRVVCRVLFMLNLERRDARRL